MMTEKIIVKILSANFWWGVYGFDEKTDWEDIDLFYENGDEIGSVCLNARSYLRDGIDQLKEKESEKDFVAAIESFLAGNETQYWYYTDKSGNQLFHEVNFDDTDPKRKQQFMDIWYPVEDLDLNTVENAIKEYALKVLKIDNCIIEIENYPSEEALKSYNDFYK